MENKKLSSNDRDDINQTFLNIDFNKDSPTKKEMNIEKAYYKVSNTY